MKAEQLQVEKAEIFRLKRDIESWEKRCGIAERENDSLRAALEFYANEEKWEQTVDLPFELEDYCSEVEMDNGCRARKALAGDSDAI